MCRGKKRLGAVDVSHYKFGYATENILYANQKIDGFSVGKNCSFGEKLDW